MDTLYRKVKIKSEQDLPKEDEKYYFHTTGDFTLRFCSPCSAAFRQLKRRIDYYFQPVEPQEANCKIEIAYLDRYEVAKVFNITLTTLNKWTKKGIVKVYKEGHRVWYKADEIYELAKTEKFRYKTPLVRPIQPKEHPKTADWTLIEKIYLSKPYEVDLKTGKTYLFKKDVMEAMEEYAQQERAIEVTDEEIESQFLMITNSNGNYVTEALNNAAMYKQIGAKWLRDKLKLNGLNK